MSREPYRGYCEFQHDALLRSSFHRTSPRDAPLFTTSKYVISFRRPLDPLGKHNISILANTCPMIGLNSLLNCHEIVIRIRDFLRPIILRYISLNYHLHHNPGNNFEWVAHKQSEPEQTFAEIAKGLLIATSL